jgi:hypothetical protein
MKLKLYIVCSHSCMSQMELAYLLNNSLDIEGTTDPELNWATYELNGATIDHEPGPFGDVRVHDDYWNIDLNEREYYNFDVRNTMHITPDQLDKMYELATIRGTLCLLIHAHNTDDVMAWAQDKDATVIITAIGKWERDIELWTMREFNYLMQDEHNANYSDDDHSLEDIDAIVEQYIHRVHIDKEWQQKSCDLLIYQSEWQRAPDIYGLWDKVGLESPGKEWIDNYLDVFYNKQRFETEKLQKLREAFEEHDEYKALF